MNQKMLIKLAETKLAEEQLNYLSNVLLDIAEDLIKTAEEVQNQASNNPTPEQAKKLTASIANWFKNMGNKIGNKIKDFYAQGGPLGKDWYRNKRIWSTIGGAGGVAAGLASLAYYLNKKKKSKKEK